MQKKSDIYRKKAACSQEKLYGGGIPPRCGRGLMVGYTSTCVRVHPLSVSINSWMDSAENWCLVREPLSMHFTQNLGYLLERTCNCTVYTRLSTSISSRSLIAQKKTYWFYYACVCGYWPVCTGFSVLLPGNALDSAG